MLVATALIALVMCSPASGKVGVSIIVGDRAPAVGEQISVVVRTQVPLRWNLRLIAVAPGQPVFPVVATITGDTSRPVANVSRDGFEIHLVRAARNRWRGLVQFSRHGRWQLVVPNEAPEGVMLPHGAALLTVTVR